MPRALLHKPWTPDDDAVLGRLWTKPIPTTTIVQADAAFARDRPKEGVGAGFIAEP